MTNVDVIDLVHRVSVLRERLLKPTNGFHVLAAWRDHRLGRALDRVASDLESLHPGAVSELGDGSRMRLATSFGALVTAVETYLDNNGRRPQVRSRLARMASCVYRLQRGIEMLSCGHSPDPHYEYVGWEEGIHSFASRPADDSVNESTSSPNALQFNRH